VFGTTPEYGDINWTGLNFTQSQFDNITSIDKAAWLQELKLHTELFDKLAYHLPEQLKAVKKTLEARLAA
jgi:phosphoenolpyruvate carboxykinase (GTP)